MTKSKIVLVPFPFDDLSTKGAPRCLSYESFGPYRHIVLAFVTSRVPDVPLPSDIVIHAEDAGFSATGLRVSSTLQLHRLMTVTTNLIRRELGQLSPRLQAEVAVRLRMLFELQ